IVLTGSCSYVCAGVVASNYIKLFGDTITTKDLATTNNLFDNSTLEYIPFDLNYKNDSSNPQQIQQTFNNSRLLKSPPKMLNVSPMTMYSLFYSCENLIEIPEDFFDTWNFDNSYMANATSSSYGRCGSMFQGCYCLRKLPLTWVKKMNPFISYSYNAYYNMFANCYVLDEIANMPVPFTKGTWTSSGVSLVNCCHRLKKLTFETNEDGSPIVVQWKNQTLNLGNNTYNGYVQTGYPERMRNAGIYDKQVTDDATYQALKNDPDWWTLNKAYSRYNKTSAIETINSLPDTSAYLATAGGTNTIKFLGAAGSLTDGGAINTLTEEEIAIAAAKGWTVSFD
ncbi:MAG: hypothetical protein IKY67_06560, partial [Paludibacteraceae bacterium]|nr:hypothetical protein [Paludibacteraceae bacterium]